MRLMRGMGGSEKLKGKLGEEVFRDAVESTVRLVTEVRKQFILQKNYSIMTVSAKSAPSPRSAAKVVLMMMWSRRLVDEISLQSSLVVSWSLLK